MADFVVMSNIILLILAIIFFYIWIRKKFSTEVAFTTTFIFAMAGPLIFHTHRHIMFNNYMFFLVLALMFVDTYFDKKKKSPLILSVLLIIMTSYYYSVGAIITICIYALYRYVKDTKKIEVKPLMVAMIKFVLTLMVPILISAILLLPTIYALKNGRSPTVNNTNILSLFIPKFSLDTYMYQSYSVGLSAILIYSIVDNFISKESEAKLLSVITIILVVFPIIGYLLNGMMYINGKCFIPMLPLFCFMIASSLNNFTKSYYDFKTLLKIVFITVIIIICMNLDYKYLAIFIIDNIILISGLLLFANKKNTIY